MRSGVAFHSPSASFVSVLACRKCLLPLSPTEVSLAITNSGLGMKPLSRLTRLDRNALRPLFRVDYRNKHRTGTRVVRRETMLRVMSALRAYEEHARDEAATLAFLDGMRKERSERNARFAREAAIIEASLGGIEA